MSAWGGVRVCGDDTTVCGVVWESVGWCGSVWGGVTMCGMRVCGSDIVVWGGMRVCVRVCESVV